MPSLDDIIEYNNLVQENTKRIGPEKTQRYLAVLQANKDKDFVQRVLNPAPYPKKLNPDGGYSSHRMSSAEVDGRYIAFPTLFHDKIKGELYTSPDPIREALNRGDYIEFSNPEDAEGFASNGYKVGMNTAGPKIPNYDAILALLKK